MTICQTLTLDYDEEMQNTRKLLERLPMDEAHLDYAPHKKSMPLGKLATHVAEIPSWAKLILDADVLEIPADFNPRVIKDRKELLETFDKGVAEGRESLQKATDEQMHKTWTFKYADIFSMTEPRTKVIRGMINHMVHHRAQLGVYLRMNEIPVPGMYGPTADEA